jgi:hypothetical protein
MEQNYAKATQGKGFKIHPGVHATGDAIKSDDLFDKANELATHIFAIKNKDTSIERVTLPWKTDKFVLKVRHALSPSVCRELIQLSERAGYEPALVNIGHGRQKYIPEYRSSFRVMLDHDKLANTFFKYIEEHLPLRSDYRGLYKPRECNERIRFLKYDNAGYFQQHCDGSYARPRTHTRFGDRSYLTLLVYLNQEYEGCTRLFSDDGSRSYDVKPETGMILVHDHSVLHEGAPISNGVKYAIRTDVMYTPCSTDVIPSSEHEKENYGKEMSSCK